MHFWTQVDTQGNTMSQQSLQEFSCGRCLTFFGSPEARRFAGAHFPHGVFIDSMAYDKQAAELWKDKFLLFSATSFIVICYGKSMKLSHLRSSRYLSLRKCLLSILHLWPPIWLCIFSFVMITWKSSIMIYI